MSEVRAEAHGRVNLIGEHTDYNGGWVLPTLIPQGTRVILRRRDDRRVEARTGLPRETESEPALGYALGEERPTGHWIDYVQGLTCALARDGHPLGGFDLEVESNMPIGSGLSSSAALEVAVGKALREAFGLKLTDEQIALLGQRCENEFVGAHVGVMDQMAASLGRPGEALFLDTQKLEFERVPLPLDRIDLIVISSGVRHKLADGGGYNQRRAECEEACRLLGLRSLRSASTADGVSWNTLPEVLRRRVRHVVSENARVHEAVGALKHKEFLRLGMLMYESHLSQKDDYEVSVPEIDLLVSLCRERRAILGARLTGGGFGGSIVAIASAGAGSESARAVAADYEKRTGIAPRILVPEGAA